MVNSINPNNDQNVTKYISETFFLCAFSCDEKNTFALWNAFYDIKDVRSNVL